MTNERYVSSVSNTNSTVCNRRSSAFIELETSLRDARNDDKALSDWCISSLTDYILGSQHPARVDQIDEQLEAKRLQGRSVCSTQGASIDLTKSVAAHASG
jgi:hypothetical protein